MAHDPAIKRRLQGIYRPLVAQAWKAHCKALAFDPADGVAYNAWYRRILLDTCALHSTSAATPEQMEELIAAFQALASSKPAVNLAWYAPRISELSEAQQEQYEKLAIKAWRKNVPEHADPNDPQAFVEWLASILHQLPEQRDARRTFEAIMQRLAILAQDEYWLRALAESDERRMRYLINSALQNLTELTGEPHDWRYVQGIHARAKIAASLDDCPADSLRSIFQILDSHVRRLRNRTPRALESAPF